MLNRQLLPIDALPAWAQLNGIKFHDIEFKKLEYGSGIVAKTDKEYSSAQEAAEKPEILMTVPPDMVLSLDLVHEFAKSDPYLRAVLEASGDFGWTARGAILIFLLCHITYASNTHAKIGVQNPWSEYIKFLPSETLLPTLWTEDELVLLYGTSLKDAVDHKLSALEAEFDRLRDATRSIAWCEREWWDEETGQLTLDDWKIVDAMYRSRALDLPGSGHVMVPCVDMANHASGEETVALYETDKERNAVLQLRWGKKLKREEEVTITYGDEKGASEMVFSYGFLENSVEDARQLFLPIDIPDDDLLKQAKKRISGKKTAPGLRLAVENGKTVWESDFIFWGCVNEEDGLSIEMIQPVEGPVELKALWKGEIEIGQVIPGLPPNSNLRELRTILSQDPLWDLFQLRAAVLVQQCLQSRVEMLGGEMEMAFESVEHDADGSQTGVRSAVYEMIRKLRLGETALLQWGLKDLANEIDQLMASQAVQEYLKQQQQPEEEDFS
ncbi:hypothetical protein TMatcc_006145 [Talaromyces marneffei ATCC 18224]|uniref:SET domain protein n=1 Tax=Talaromyces marneffei (strain ATCC 18224 / CBS 334.59 / QM 7333) TaxID=441960 RepID=B6QCG9_TALMQ|nr:uncharacterized protein EYB26_002889 [Talaromyces marneffei]EEA25623.1 SET domain protein [Talaromyces marneffei ATCC 18224]QGA15232.1 hypothetical protein EYB26_002889 [Talaromyces marneffei]